MRPEVMVSPDARVCTADALEQAFQAGSQSAAGDGVVGAAPADAPQETRTETAFEGVLTDPAGITVDAEYKIKTKGSTTNYKFQVKVQGGPPSATWDVVAD